MLLSVSFYVIFSTLPATLVYVLMTMFPEGEYFDLACQPVDMSADPTWRQYVVYITVQKIVNEICLSHYACNFFLFTITGLEFRRELYRVVGCVVGPVRGGRESSFAENGTEYSVTTAVRPPAHSLKSPEIEELRTFVVSNTP